MINNGTKKTATQHPWRRRLGGGGGAQDTVRVGCVFASGSDLFIKIFCKFKFYVLEEYREKEIF
jgi:hypothetical protein